MTRSEWRRIGAMAAVVAALHAIGFFLLLALVVPGHFSLGDGGAFGVGVGITAYTLGLRHAFDADHISAIDNTTRKLREEGGRPLSVGFFFSLGHSTVVVALGLLIALGVGGLGTAVENDGSTLHQVTGTVGPLVSGGFLLLVGLLNLSILAGVLGAFRRMRRGEHDEAELEHRLASRGLMNRLYGRAAGTIRRPWQMYPLGCLFGLGFDTATEVAVLVLAGAGAASGLPFHAVLCLPLLFAAGMTLFDTLDGVLIGRAYEWAFERPLRKLFYNAAVTTLSVAVALLIGTLELVSVLADRLGLEGGVWSLLAAIDLNMAGYAVVALFLLAWAAALAVWCLGRFEQRSIPPASG